MATTINTDVFNPEILTDAVEGAFAQKTAFMGSKLVSLGIALVEGSMPEGGPDAIGKEVTVPYFGTIGEFTDNPDGSSLTPKAIKQTSETSAVSRDSLGFSVSRWAEKNALVNSAVDDPYDEAARQIVEAATRAIDKRLITAASASGVYVKDVYSTSAPGYLDWDLCVDAKVDGWGDESDDSVAAMLCHSQTHKGLLKLKDSTGRPLLLTSQANGGPIDTFCGLPVVVSDRAPLTGSTMGSVTSSGTSPPVLTLTGTPNGAYKLVVDCVLGGAHGTATVRFSVDNGNIWSDPITTHATPGTAQALTDPAIDSRVAVNGVTGLSFAFAAGTFNADNLYSASTAVKATTMLLKRGALAFWYSSGNLGLETDKDIRAHSREAAMHLYGVAHRYRRVRGPGTRPGVIQIVHNVGGYV
jgi:hypothetical protein